MKPYAKILAGAAAAALMSTAASAADFVTLQPSSPAPLAAPGFDWSGPYAGAHIGIFNLGGQSYQYGGVQFGRNFLLRGNLLAGLEVETSHLFLPGFPIVSAFLNGRLGYVVGDRVLLYGEAGIGTFMFGATGLYSLGGGVEIAVNDAISVFGEFNRQFIIGAGVAPYGNIEFGFNYHPGGAMMAASATPFQGLYMGTFAGYAFGAPSQFEFGVQVGFNHSLGRFVVGTEVATYYSVPSGAFINAELNARLGANFGNFLAYGEAGIGTFFTTPYWGAGGGLELALGGRNISVFTEAKALFALGGGGYFATRIDAGVNFAAGQ